jgi:hypothetical protein
MTIRSLIVDKKLYLRDYCYKKKSSSCELVKEHYFLEEEQTIKRKREYHYKKNLKWLSYLIPTHLFQAIHNFTTILRIEKQENTMDLEISDVANDYYNIQISIKFQVQETNQTHCHIEIKKFTPLLPMFIKNRIENLVLNQLESDIKDFI